MARDYDIAGTSSAETAALDFLELQPGDDLPNKIDGMAIGQITELADAAEEQLAMAIRRGNSTSGSGGVTTTANPKDANDSAYGGTTPETLNDTKATTSGSTVRGPWSFNVRIGYFELLPDTKAHKVDQGDARSAVELVGAPADSITWEVGFDIREF